MASRLATPGEASICRAAAVAPSGRDAPYAIRRLYELVAPVPVDRPTLRRLCDSLSAHHPQLRARYLATSGELVCATDGEIVLSFAEGAATTAERWDAVNDLPCDAAGPTMSMVGFCDGERVTHLGMTVHHVVCDLASESALVRDLEELLLGGGRWDRPEDQLFAAHAARVIDALRSEERRTASVEHWRRVAADCNRTFAFPLSDRLASRTIEQRGHRHRVSIERTAVPRRDRGVLPVAGFIAAAHLAASVLCRDRRVPVAFSLSGRPAGHERTVGYYVHVVPLFLWHDDEETVGDVRRRASTMLVDAEHHAVEYWRLAGQDGRMPRPPVIVDVRSALTPLTARSPVLRRVPGIGRSSRPKFDLELRVLSRGSHHTIDAIVRGTVAERDSSVVEDLVSRFLLAPSDAVVGAVPLVDSPSQHDVAPAAFDDLSAVVPPTAAVIEEAAVHPLGPLVDAARESIAPLLAGDAPVVLALPRGTALVAVTVALAQLGVPAVPVDPTYPKARLERMLTQVRPQLVIVTEPSERVAGAQARHVAVGELLRDRGEAVAPGGRSRGVLSMFFTSGSTGDPKGVMVTREGVANFAEWFIATTGIGPTDRCLQFSSPGFDASLMDMWPAVAAGATVVVVDPAARFDPARLQSFIVQNDVTVAFLPTRVGEALISMAWPACRFRVLLTGGETLRSRPPADLPFRFLNVYGPTETTIIVTGTEIDDVDDGYRLPSIGRPITNATVRVFDELGREVPDGVVGEAVIGGVPVSAGYLAESPGGFVELDGRLAYRSGDLVRYRPDGLIDHYGRRDRQVKIRSHRVELTEVEAALLACPGVASTAVVVVDHDGRAHLEAVVTTRDDDSSMDLDEVRRMLRRDLPPAMVPHRIIAVPAIPTTAHGKTDEEGVRRLLSEPSPNAVRVAEDGAGDLDGIVRAAWVDVFAGEAIDGASDFFDLGGDSLAAISLAEALSEALQIDVPLSFPFLEPTVDGQTELLRRVTAGELSLLEL